MHALPLPQAGARGRDWVHAAVDVLEHESARSADTHLLALPLPRYPGVQLYLKDESSHPSGSLKHRLARSLFLYALCNGRLRAGQEVIDASSGSTAISEAWFSRLLGVSFTAVMPASTAPGKVRELLALGAQCDLIPDGVDCTAHARERAQRHGLCFLDQFGLAERATDWRGNNNIAESLLQQMSREPAPVPAWIVCGAGTGGTSATIGRYLRYRRVPTRLCVAEPRGGAFARGWQAAHDHPGVPAAATLDINAGSLIEGIGRRRVEPGFLFEVVERVIEIDDVDSCAAAWLLEQCLGRRYGGSSGTNLVACLQLARQMHERGEDGSIVSLLCDRGERYAETLFAPSWLASRKLDLAPALARLRAQLRD